MKAECKSTEEALSELISAVILEYPPSAEFRVEDVLAAHPELGSSREAIIKLLLEEYCRRHEDQESIDVDEFVRRFPGMEDSLRKEINQHSTELARQRRLSQPNWPAPDSQFHDWSLRRLIGRGGFSRVYLADEPKVGNRPVALKLTTRGRHECDLVGRLNHPGICQILSVRDDDPDGITAIAMPYHGEATLHDLIEQFWHGRRTLGDDELPSWETETRSPGFVAQVVTMAVPLCDALEYAHGQGVLHCDLKPSNILIKPDGAPVLLDFNLAFSLHDEKGVVGGTMGYMAPEQVRALNRREKIAIDARADVFGLGAVLYHALCGSAAFVVERRDDNDTRVDRPLEFTPAAPPQLLTERNPGIPSALSDLIARCLEFDPQRRPGSIREVREALAKLLPATAPPLEQVSIRPSRRLLLGLSLASVTAAIAVVAGIALSGPEEPVAIDIHQEISRLRLIPASNATASEQELLAYYLCLVENWQEAKEVLVGLVDAGDASIGVRHNLAYCEMRIGGGDSASQLYLEALEADPEQGKTWAALTYHDAFQSMNSQRFPYRDYLFQTERNCEDRELAELLDQFVEATTRFQKGRIRQPLSDTPDGMAELEPLYVAIANVSPTRWLIAPDDFPSGVLVTQVSAN